MARNKRDLSGGSWRVLILLALSLFINYVDRGNLSIAAPLIKDEFGLSPWHLGILFSAFFWTYASFLVLSGWLVDRFEVKWVLAGGFFLWSAATMVTGLVSGFISLLIVRLILGMGESTAYPSYSRILSRFFPEHKRGMANSVISIGLGLGPAFGTFAGGMLMARFGWRPFFVVLGLITLLWLIPWLRWMPRQHLSAEARKQIFVPTILEILKQRSAWGSIGGLFCLNYLSYFLITWLPYYLVHERHFSMDNMAKTIGLAYVMAGVASPAAGWISDRWIISGATPTLVRKTVMGAGQVAAGVFLGICVVAGPTLAVVCLLLAAASYGVCSSNTWAITQTLAGPDASGKWTGVQNFMGNLAGVAAPAVAGIVVERTGEFFWAFAITGLVAVLGSLSWVFVIGPLKETEWKGRVSRPLAVSGAELS